MKKHITTIATAAALSLVLLLCVFAAKTPTEGTNVSDVPADTAPVLSAADTDLPAAEADKAYTLTITHKDADGNIIAQSETKEVKAGEPYATPALRGHADQAEPEEPHETIESLLEKGVLTPYRIPGFPIAGPFWEKYGMTNGEAVQDDSADATTEVETNKVYTVTVTYVDSEGNKIFPSETKEVKVGQPYTVSSPTITGYTYMSKTTPAHKIVAIAALLIGLLGCVLAIGASYVWFKKPLIEAEAYDDSDDTTIPPEDQ